MANYLVDDNKCLNNIENVKASTSKYGSVKLSENLSTPPSEPGIALAGSAGFVLNTRINQANADIEDVKIPITGGVGMSVSASTASAYAEQVGYGTWTACGTITTSNNTVIYCYSRGIE